MKKLTTEIQKAIKAENGVFYQGNKILAAVTYENQCFVMVEKCSQEIRVVHGAEIRFGEGMDARRGA